MGLSPSPLCNKCNLNEEETVGHFLFRCWKHTRFRHKVFGKPFLNEAEIIDLPLQSILKVAKLSFDS